MAKELMVETMDRYKIVWSNNEMFMFHSKHFDPIDWHTIVVLSCQYVGLCRVHFCKYYTCKKILCI